MRLDKYLKVSRIIKRRTVANEACDAGRVLVNGKAARASYDVKIGDVIEIAFGNRTVKAEVLEIKESPKKDETAEMFYDVVSGYKEDYFASQALVICVIHAPNASNRYESEGIGRSGTEGEYDLRIRVSAPATASEEAVAWHLFLEVPDSSPFLRDSAEIHVRYVERKGY